MVEVDVREQDAFDIKGFRSLAVRSRAGSGDVRLVRQFAGVLPT